jgi:hypothetical protein
MCFEAVMLSPIALEYQEKNGQTTFLIEKSPNYISLITKLSKKAF